MRLLDTIRTKARDRRFEQELRSLAEKIAGGSWKREAVIAHLPLPALAGDILDFEGVFSAFEVPEHPTPAETLEASEFFKRLLALHEGNRVEKALQALLAPLAGSLPQLPRGEDFGLFACLIDLLPDPASVIEEIVLTALGSPLPRLSRTVQRNLLLASGVDPSDPQQRPLVMPTAAKDLSGHQLVDVYLRQTPFVDFFRKRFPFTIPASVRFEHTHIIGGSGHGKTQLLQTLILRDIGELQHGRSSLVVIDSQGDMIRNLTHLSAFTPAVEGGLADRLVLIDPNDIEHPPCLNLFDFGFERFERYSPLDREKLLNAAIALYEYLFGALLGAELTQRQSVIFRYLGRLLMTLPGATIHTLVQFMEDPEAARPHFAGLEGSARHFFETQFATAAFKDTRQQILNRLWGVLSNAVLERMFSNERNKINIFEAMNSGKIVLINTAKDLLKHDGCAIFGRFFIALITQAAQERAAIPADKRRAAFLYIDEAQDYFDESVEQLFNQARKYKVGLVVAHQNLDQFERELLASVMASTSIKLVGGMSAKDAAAIAKEMRCEPELLQSMRKHHEHTEFACFVRNITPAPLRLTVPLGTMEKLPRLSGAEYDELLELNRLRYCATAADHAPTRTRQRGRSVGGFELGRPEVF